MTNTLRQTDRKYLSHPDFHTIKMVEFPWLRWFTGVVIHKIH